MIEITNFISGGIASEFFVQDGDATELGKQGAVADDLLH